MRLTRLAMAGALALAAMLVPVRAPAPTASFAALDTAFGPAQVSAASPTPPPAGAADPRSAGEGPGLVGTPLIAIGAVLGIGVATVLVTFAYVQLTGGPRRPD